MVSRLFSFLFGSLFLLGVFFMANEGMKYVKTLKTGIEAEAEVIGLLNIKLGKGKYLVQNSNSAIPDTAYSKDYTVPYAVGDLVTVYETPRRIYIFEWKNTALYL